MLASLHFRPFTVRIAVSVGKTLIHKKPGNWNSCPKNIVGFSISIWVCVLNFKPTWIMRASFYLVQATKRPGVQNTSQFYFWSPRVRSSQPRPKIGIFIYQIIVPHLAPPPVSVSSFSPELRVLVFLPRSWMILDNLEFLAKILDFLFLSKILDSLDFLPRSWPLIFSRNSRTIKISTINPRPYRWNSWVDQRRKSQLFFVQVINIFQIEFHQPWNLDSYLSLNKNKKRGFWNRNLWMIPCK